MVICVSILFDAACENNPWFYNFNDEGKSVYIMNESKLQSLLASNYFYNVSKKGYIIFILYNQGYIYICSSPFDTTYVILLLYLFPVTFWWQSHTLTFMSLTISIYFQVMRSSMWILLEMILVGALLLYATVSIHTRLFHDISHTPSQT